MIASSVVLAGRQIEADGRLTLTFEPAGSYEEEVTVTSVVAPRSPLYAARFDLKEGEVFDLELKARDA